MALPSLPVTFSDISTAWRRIAETINQLIKYQVAYPTTAAEAAAGVIPTNFGYAPGDVRRYGITPNDSGKATNNVTVLQALLDPTKTGPVGALVFPNTTGADIYYFNDMTDVRDGIRIDLGGCTLHFSKTYASADDTRGWFNFIRDVTIENGTINVDYDGSAGTNPGPCLRVGSRNGCPFGSYTAGIFDKDDLTSNGLPVMGNIAIRNMRFTSNNTGVIAMVMMFGGLRNVTMENCHFDGQGVVFAGVYYEFGFASKNGSSTTSNWTSSHACNLRFTNLHAENLEDVGTGDSGVVALVGAHHAVMDGCIVDTCINGITCRAGEALFFRPWTPTDSEGAKRGISVRNCIVSNSSGDGLNLIGAEAASAGYLSGASLTASQQVDLLEYEIAGCNVSAAGFGAFISGPFAMRNCRFDGAAGSGQVFVSDDCTQFDINRIDAVNSVGGAGVALGGSDIGVWATKRQKMGRIANSLIAGNSAGQGIIVKNSRSVEIVCNRIGYNTLYDAAAETSQTSGIDVVGGTGGGGVMARGNYISTNSGTAYTVSGTPANTCNIKYPKGEVSTSGSWDLDGMALVSSTQLADKTNLVNTTDKLRGRRAMDTTNNKLYLATGSTATSNWELADGSASVTPA